MGVPVLLVLYFYFSLLKFTIIKMPLAVSYKIDNEYIKHAVIAEFNSSSAFLISCTTGELVKISSAIESIIIMICSLTERSICDFVEEKQCIPSPLFLSTMSMTLVNTIPIVAALIASKATRIVTKLFSRNLCKKDDSSHIFTTSIEKPIPREKNVVFTTVVILASLSLH